MSFDICSKMLIGLSGAPAFNHFTMRDVNRVSGRTKYRNLGAPNEAMKALHRRFGKYLRSARFVNRRTECLTYSTASKRGDTTRANVLPHRLNRFFYLLDFHNAFGNVNPRRLAEVLARLDERLAGAETEVEEFLKTYFFTPEHGLVQGGNAAPDLFNLYAGMLVDGPLTSILHAHGITYTRYLDDLTFSSKSHITEATRRQIREIITRAGFSLSWRKCEYVDLRKRTVMITGIGLEYGGRMFVPRRFVRKVRAVLHAAGKRESGVSRNTIEGLMSPLRSTVPSDQKPNRLEEKVWEAYKVARRAYSS